MVDIHREETQGAHIRPAHIRLGLGTGAGDEEGRRHGTPGESAPVKLLAA